MKGDQVDLVLEGVRKPATGLASQLVEEIWQAAEKLCF
jgi:hypothetical protein